MRTGSLSGSGGKLTLCIRGSEDTCTFSYIFSRVLQLCLDLFLQQHDGLPSEPGICSAKDMMLFFVDRGSAFKELRGSKNAKLSVMVS